LIKSVLGKTIQVILARAGKKLQRHQARPP